MSSKDPILCQKDKTLFKNKKIFYAINNKIRKFNRDNSKIKYFSDNDLSFVQNNIKNIIGFSALNLESYGNKLRVFYPEKINDKLQEIIFFFFNREFKIKNWNMIQKKNHLKALQLITDFLNIDLIEVDKFSDADIVVSNFIENANFYGVSTFPHELDLYNILENKLFIFYPNFSDNENSSRGSKRFYYFLHHILHCFGLKHHETPISSQCNTKNILYYDSIFSTLMFSELNNEYYPQTLMPLDIEALKFLYTLNNFTKYLKWLDLNCSKDIIQTLIGNISLSLSPEKFSRIFNLSIDSYKLSNGADFQTNCSVISKSANDKIGGTILASGCYYKQILVNYEELNIYASNIIEETKIIVSGNKVRKINIYLQGFEKDYYIDEQKIKIVIVHKKNKGVLLIDNNQYPNIDVELFLLGNKLLEKFPEKIKNYNDFADIEDSDDEKEIIQIKNNIQQIDKKYFVDISQNIPIEEPEEPEQHEKNKQSRQTELPDQQITTIEENDDVGNSIISNLQQEHYFEIIQEFFNKFPEMINTPNEKIVDILNAFAVHYISRRFKNKLKGRTFPHMAEMLEKKKNEFKNTSFIN